MLNNNNSSSYLLIPLLSLVTAFFSFPLANPSMEPRSAPRSPLLAGGAGWGSGGAADGGGGAKRKQKKNAVTSRNKVGIKGQNAVMS